MAKLTSCVAPVGGILLKLKLLLPTFLYVITVRIAFTVLITAFEKGYSEVEKMQKGTTQMTKK